MLVAVGLSNKEIGQRIDLPRQIVSKWRKRFFDQRLAGLREKPRRGTRRFFPVEQTWKYMDKCGTAEGHLVIFDPNEKRTWDEKIFLREEEYRGYKIIVWDVAGCRLSNGR